MADVDLSEVLSQIGWDRKFTIPMTNTENKALEEEIQRIQKEIANEENMASQFKEGSITMTELLKNFGQEVTHTQALCRAVENQTRSDLHFKALGEREMGRLRQEISQLQNDLLLLQEKEDLHEKCISKDNQMMEKLKVQLNWDQQTLDEWLAQAASKDEDTMAIVKYAQQDESKIRELTLNVEKFTLEANQKKKALNNESTEMIMAQVALEKTVELMQQNNTERKELIKQWENSIGQNRKKDQDLQKCALLRAETNKMIFEREALMREEQDFLANEMEKRKDCEKNIGAIKRNIIKLKQQFEEQESRCTQLQDELVSLKSIVDQASTELEAKRSHLAYIKKDINEKTSKLEHVRKHNIHLEDKLRAVSEETLSTEETANQMEQLHKDQEKRLKETDTQLQRESKLLFQKKQELQNLELKEKNILADILGIRTTISVLDNTLRIVEQNTLKKQECIKNQDFEIGLLEGKVARLSGNMNKEEKQALEKQVSELTNVMEEKKKAAAILVAQLKKLQTDICFVKKENEKMGAEKRDLTIKMDELNLSDDTMEKILKKLCLKKQESIVDNNILQLEVKRLRTLLYDKADSVLSLEKRKLQLQTAMKERQKEICVLRETHNKQIKITEQGLQGLRAHLHEQLSKADKIKKKFEIITACMPTPEVTEDKSLAYYIIKAAQKKEELQRKINTLDAKICQTEKENKALENSLQKLNNHTSAYRKSFNKITESSPEYQEKLELEEKKKMADEKIIIKRQQIRELQENIESSEGLLNNLQQEKAAQAERNEDFKARIVSMKKELISQKEKLERASKQCFKLIREIRCSRNTRREIFEERDIKLKELKERQRMDNKMLLEIMKQHPDLKTILQMYFMQAGVPLPSPASVPSSRTSRLGSIQSSASYRSFRSSGSSSSESSSTRGSEVHFRIL